jgi:hypothetical protein
MRQVICQKCGRKYGCLTEGRLKRCYQCQQTEINCDAFKKTTGICKQCIGGANETKSVLHTQ